MQNCRWVEGLIPASFCHISLSKALNPKFPPNLFIFIIIFTCLWEKFYLLFITAKQADKSDMFVFEKLLWYKQKTAGLVQDVEVC